MIWDIIVALMVVLLIFSTAIILRAFYYTKKRDEGRISFKESIDLVSLPVITFMSNGRKLNFLLDSGSSNSFINNDSLKDTNHRLLGKTGTTYGMEGVEKENRTCVVDLQYKSMNFSIELCAIDLSSCFSMLKKETGVQMDGILGCEFFGKYKSVIDFEELAFYLTDKTK